MDSLGFFCLLVFSPYRKYEVKKQNTPLISQQEFNPKPAGKTLHVPNLPYLHTVLERKISFSAPRCPQAHTSHLKLLLLLLWLQTALLSMLTKINPLKHTREGKETSFP